MYYEDVYTFYIGAFLYYLIKAQFKSIILDILIFLFVRTSHLIFSYYFLPIELLIGLTGASILYTILKS
jgi:genome